MEPKTYYVTGNTAFGFVNLLASNIENMKETIQLPHSSYKEITAILTKLIEDNKEYSEIEILRSSISKEYVDGIIFRDKQIAVIGNINPAFTNKAYDLFHKGLQIHDKLEEVFIKEMDFDKADKIADVLHKKLLKNIPKQKRTPKVYRRLFGTNTMDGVVNEVPNLIKNLQQVYHIKGRAGTGKSTFMRRVLDACFNHGLDLELYHCSFDSNSIDMVLIPELSTCLFDSTNPHEFYPKDKQREKVIDLYEETVTPGTDEKYEKEITELTKEYKAYMKQGISVIKKEGKEILKKDNEKTYSETKVNETVRVIQSKLN